MRPAFLVPPALYAVQNAPYTAVFEQTWIEPGSGIQHRIVSRMLVDGKGRQRFEMGSDECIGHASTTVSVHVYDVMARTLFTLDEVHRLVRTGSMPPTHTDPIQVPPTGWPTASDPRPRDTPDRTRITETQQIAGLLALGTRTVRQADGREIVDELWVSPQYRIPLVKISSNPQTGTVVTRMTRFTTGEPDEMLFQMPAGYAPAPPGAGSPPWN